MSEGVRLYHPTHRDAVLLVPHPGDPATGRKPKDYHLRIDSTGHVIVSETIWRRLQEAAAAGFPSGLVAVNAVKAPPAQGIGVGGGPAPGRLAVPRVYRVAALRGQAAAAVEDMQRTGKLPKVKPRISRLRRKRDT